MSTSDFLNRAAELLVVARQVAIRRGIRYRTPNLVMEQKKLFGDLKSLAGLTSFSVPRTDPIDPSAWWKFPPPVVSSGAAGVPPPAPAPSTTSEKDTLVDIVSRNRRSTGEKRILWKFVHVEWMRQYPASLLSLNQLKHRYRSICRTLQTFFNSNFCN